jgi:hypothetical protein
MSVATVLLLLFSILLAGATSWLTVLVFGLGGGLAVLVAGILWIAMVRVGYVLSK